MALLLVTPEILDEISDMWSAECDELGEDFSTYSVPSFEHARKIVQEGATAQPEYTIHCLTDGSRHDAIVHVNRARLPGSDGVTQRVMSILLSPRFDYSPVLPEEFARLAVEIISGAMQLCIDEGRSRHIKVHLGNIADRDFFHGMAYQMRNEGKLLAVSVRGNWLQMTLP